VEVADAIDAAGLAVEWHRKGALATDQALRIGLADATGEGCLLVVGSAADEAHAAVGADKARSSQRHRHRTAADPLAEQGVATRLRRGIRLAVGQVAHPAIGPVALGIAQ